MTQIDFFTNVAQPLRLAAKIVVKAWRSHGRVRVLTPDAETTSALDRLLWTNDPLSFVPHCRMDSKVALDTPIWIDERVEHNGPAGVLVNLHPEPPPFFSRFERLAEIVPSGESHVQAGRERYRFYRERGYELRAHNLA